MEDPNAHHQQHVAQPHYAQEMGYPPSVGNGIPTADGMTAASDPQKAGQPYDPGRHLGYAPQYPATMGSMLAAQPPVLNPMYRVPISTDVVATEDEPLYVNAKQYHRILKRRAARARLEEQNKVSRQRKVT